MQYCILLVNSLAVNFLCLDFISISSSASNLYFSFYLCLLLSKIKFYVEFVLFLPVLPVFGFQNGSFSFRFVSFDFVFFVGCRLPFIYSAENV